MPVPEASAGDQVPPASGVPPSELKRSTGASEEQTSRAPSSPASAWLTIVTVTSAESSGQGEVPETV